MKLTLQKPHNSITKLNQIELPSFVVLTGTNGSGKTHLLQAVAEGKIKISDNDTIKCVYFDPSNFFLDDESNFTAQQITTEKCSAWQFFNDQLRNQCENARIKTQVDFKVLKKIAKKNKKGFIHLDAEDINDASMLASYDQYVKRIERLFHSSNLLNNHQAQAIDSLQQGLRYPIDEIKEQEFYKKFVPYTFKADFLPTQIGKSIWEYYVKWDDNKYNAYENKEHGKNYPVLTDEEFIEEHGAKPWELISGILESFSGLGFRINNPENPKLSRDTNYHFTILNEKGVEISFTHLSSGEKILMALVASIYKSSSDNRFPDVLLLDEVDASLHPSMVQNLLDAISDIFLERGTRVMLATHSPTTVALSPENSIYIMQKSSEERIKKVSKQDALNILTEGFVTLDEGLLLFDQIGVNKEVSLITEGKNTKYIEHAINLLKPDLLEKIKIINGAEGNSGDQQLKTLFDFFSKVSHDSKVLFVWDCDVTLNLNDTNNTYPYILPKNIENTRVVKGIENLLPEEVFKDSLYKTSSKDDGGSHTTLDKNLLLEEMLKSSNKADFVNFNALIEKIEQIMNTKKSNIS